MRQFGTSYFRATLLLPRHIQHETVELYKFVRIPDQIVDDPDTQDTNSKSQELDTLMTHRHTAYDALDYSDPEFGVWIHIMQHKNVDPKYVEAFFAAMKYDLICRRYENYDQLQDYMYGSAEVV